MIMEIIAGILMAITMLGVYFLPTIIAICRDNDPVGLFTINLLFGWTVLAWIWCLVISFIDYW